MSSQAVSYHVAAAVAKMRAIDPEEVDPNFELFFEECCRVAIYEPPKGVWEREQRRRRKG